MHPLDGARERLKRADENIRNLNAEITKFLAKIPIIDFPVVGNKPVFTEKDSETFEEIGKLVRDESVDPRISVLAGEVIHHMRSAFDHLAWQLTSPDVQAKPAGRKVEFPVFDSRPDDCDIGKKNKMSTYCRKVQGIASPTALARIHSLQPYLRGDFSRYPLWLIHDMDRIDKHRELVLAVYGMNLRLSATTLVTDYGKPVPFRPWEIRPRPAHFPRPRYVGPVFTSDVTVKGNMTPQILFGQLTKREDEPIIPALQNLLRFTIDSIESFAEEFA